MTALLLLAALAHAGTAPDMSMIVLPKPVLTVLTFVEPEEPFCFHRDGDDDETEAALPRVLCVLKLDVRLVKRPDGGFFLDGSSTVRLEGGAYGLNNDGDLELPIMLVAPLTGEKGLRSWTMRFRLWSGTESSADFEFTVRKDGEPAFGFFNPPVVRGRLQGRDVRYRRVKE
jgi:hypothetical protein